MLNKVSDISPYMGCDPEFFFKDASGKIIGAEKFIPKNGMVHEDVNGTGDSKFIIDGVQAELNPRPNYCRANLANEIKACMVMLAGEMKARGNGLTADFSRTVIIDKDKLMELDEKARMFGCAPSKSTSKTAGVKIASVDPIKYRTRAAGGHIHIGKGTSQPLARALRLDAARTVDMLDILCGNTAVLVDRDEGNIERRKMYGRAGEYRLPAHGLEYRTLSNFWLTAYPLMSFAFGMARLAVQVMADSNHEALYKEFMSKVKMRNVHAAINHNDFDTAMDNFQAVEKTMLQICGDTDRYAVHENNIKEFHHFVKMVKHKGMGYWFKQDPITHWTNIREAHIGGFSDYLSTNVRADMAARKTKKVA